MLQGIKSLSITVAHVRFYVNSRFDNVYRLHHILCLIARVGEHAWIGRLGTVGCPEVGYGLSHAITSTRRVVAGNWMADYASLICLGFDPARAFPFLGQTRFFAGCCSGERL